MLTVEAMWSRPILMAAWCRSARIAGLANRSSQTAQVWVTVKSPAPRRRRRCRARRSWRRRSGAPLDRPHRVGVAHPERDGLPPVRALREPDVGQPAVRALLLQAGTGHRVDGGHRDVDEVGRQLDRLGEVRPVGRPEDEHPTRVARTSGAVTTISERRVPAGTSSRWPAVVLVAVTRGRATFFRRYREATPGIRLSYRDWVRLLAGSSGSAQPRVRVAELRLVVHRQDRVAVGVRAGPPGDCGTSPPG